MFAINEIFTIIESISKAVEQSGMQLKVRFPNECASIWHGKKEPRKRQTERERGRESETWGENKWMKLCLLPVVLVVLSNCLAELAINSIDWYSYRMIRIWWKFSRCCFYWSVNYRMWWSTMMLRPIPDSESSACFVCWSICSSSCWQLLLLLLSLCCAVHKRK